MGLPLDSLLVGDWIICTRGFKTNRQTAFGERYEHIERNVEGVLFRVMALSGMIVFLKVYPVPSQLPGATIEQPWNGVFKYTDMEWQRASKSFVRTYLKQMRVKPEPVTHKPKMLTAGEVFDIFKLPGQDPPGRKFK